MLCVKLELTELAEARGIVISHSLGVSKAFQQRVGLEQLVNGIVADVAGDVRDVSHHDLHCLRLAGTTLPRN